MEFLSAQRPLWHPEEQDGPGSEPWTARLSRRLASSKPTAWGAALAAAGLAATIDYLVGYEVRVSFGYLAGVGIAAWYLSLHAGVLLAALSVALGLAGDLAGGRPFPSPLVGLWNELVLLGLLCTVATLLAWLARLQRGLEQRVSQRTLALTEEIATREKLEREVLEAGEREKQRLGHELHDGICQQLTAAAMMAETLVHQLATSSEPPVERARGVLRMIGDSMEMCRQLAHGLQPVDAGADGLMRALEAHAAQVTEVFKVPCAFECPAPVAVSDVSIARHLYRIAQQAISNALQHSRTARLTVRLEQSEEGILLWIRDFGRGLPKKLPAARGVGLRSMSQRAAMIGGELQVRPADVGEGTLVTCRVPFLHGSGSVSRE